MKMKKAKEIEQLQSAIKNEISHWQDIVQNGCYDPSWCDGANMNLTRNHIIYDKSRLKKLCEENYIQLPYECFLPTPPKVANTYMADLKCDRAKRLKRFHNLTHEKIKYQDDQLSLI